ncbi:hypothetical protein Bca52824_017447 [Brassica carinata]|uniref:Uncharacterized protein n=1 Tax=Brassica carinata TaxID=52824 RepID=A0A8X7VP45_BRACI|nr:hypothetical protein Bca52824_017447 [Brassica carinata]
MADALRALLDSGKLSEEECLAILRGLQEKEEEKQKQKEVDGWTSSDEEEEVDEEYCRQVRESLGFDIDAHVRIPERGISPCELGKSQPPCDIALYGRLGVHCFNFEKGRKLQFMRIPKYNIGCSIWISYYITVEVKDLVDDSAHILQSSVTDSFSQNGEHLRVFTQICRLKPEKPGEGECAFSLLDEKAVDEFYKGRMPNFLSEAKPAHRLRFYEVQEQDICQNDWLRLYTDFALYCYWRYNESAFKSCLPAKINKILVETFETHTDPSLKLKSSNAIFHINLTAKSRDYISVVRRTTDGKTGHIILQISTWTNPPSSP